MDLSLILKIAGLGIIVTIVCQVLNKSGRDEQAMMVTIAGIIIAMLVIIREVGGLFETVKSIFGL
ncbi:MAG: stage III sporulation protein AC [Clostridia bacterium]|nr:stage III sporulation protein AC [Clostridia bacterium]